MNEWTEKELARRYERKPLYHNEPQTLGEMIIRAFSEKKRADCLNYKKNGKWLSVSSEKCIERGINIALGLKSIGLQKGDCAAIWSANCPEWNLTDFGCQLNGIVDVPVYTTLAPPQVCYILNDSDAKTIFLQNREYYEKFLEKAAECKSVKTFILFEDENLPNDGRVLSLKNLEERGARLNAENPYLIEEMRRVINAFDTATLIYTSGTTGEPKGVMLTHANLVTNVLDLGSRFDFAPSDTALSVLPLSHVFERMGVYTYFHSGMRVCYAESIDKAAENLREVLPTIFVGVPRIFEKVYAKAKDKAESAGKLNATIFDWAMEVAKEKARLDKGKSEIPFVISMQHSLADTLVFSKLREFFGGRLRYCISGGAALSDTIAEIFWGAGIPIMQGYGLTETSPVISSNTTLDKRIGTVGKSIPNMHVRIASGGEIEVRGAGVMRGYYKKEKATEDVFTADGYFKTGDLGEIDRDGFIKITDRKKELFKTSGGKYIAPAPIEQMIKASRLVNQVVLIGNERRFPAALIVPNFEQVRAYADYKGFSVSADDAEVCRNPAILDKFHREIDKFTRDLSSFEKIKQISLLKDEFTVEGGELTPTLKIKRRVIDEKYKDVIDKIYKDAEHLHRTAV